MGSTIDAFDCSIQCACEIPAFSFMKLIRTASAVCVGASFKCLTVAVQLTAILQVHPSNGRGVFQCNVSFPIPRVHSLTSKLKRFLSKSKGCSDEEIYHWFTM